MQKFIFQFTLKEHNQRIPVIPPYIFRSVLMKFLSKIDKKFVEELHNPNVIRPYAISIQRRNPFLNFHLISLKENLSTALLKALSTTENIPFSIANLEFILVQTKFENIPIVNLMHEVQRVQKFQVHFLTPTYFNIRNRVFDIRFPESVFLLPNTAKIWNAHAPVGCHLDENEFYEWLSKNVFVSSYELRTRPFQIGKNLSKSGCVGWANYLIKNNINSNYVNWVDILLKFAEYVNIGGNRTAACGVIKYTPLEIVITK